MNKRLQNNKYILLLLLTFFMGKGTVWADDSDPISFADSNVKALCVANWDDNNDGELSYFEAACVTDLESVFKNNTVIQSFDELQYFVNLTTIGEQAFYGCVALSQITIPEPVTSIGNQSFWNCPALQTVHFNAINCTSMQSSYDYGTYSVFSSNTSGADPALSRVYIGNSVIRIPDYAFKGCGSILQNLTIPSSVTEIGQYAFYGCGGLMRLRIQGNLQTIGQYAFYGCSAFNNGLSLPNSVITIGEYAFCYCSSLESLTLGSGVTSIGVGAFYNCCSNYIGDLVIPSSVTSIGYDAFYGWNGLSSVHYTGSLGQWLGITFGNECANPLYYGHNLYINDNLVTALSFPNDLTAIPRNVFCGCTSLSGELVIPDAVTLIGGGAFNGCSGFTGELVIPDAVTSIGDGAFNGCSGFTGELVIPDAVTYIGQYAFYGCSGLASLTIGTDVNSIGEYAFWGCPNLATLNFNATECVEMRTIIYNDYWAPDPTGSGMEVPVHEEYYYSVFNAYDYEGGASPIATLIIGEEVTCIPAYAFKNSPSIVGALLLPDAVISVGEGAFYGCSGLTSLTIGTNVIRIGDFAFWDCPNLATLNYNATNCSNMYSTYIRKEKEPCCWDWHDIHEYYSVFNSGNERGLPTPIVSLNIGENVTHIPDHAFQNSSNIVGVLKLPNVLQYVGACAFAGCSGLTGNLTFPSSVTTIGNSAFAGCTGFTGALIVSRTLNSIGNYAFCGCSGFTTVISEKPTPLEGSCEYPAFQDQYFDWLTPDGVCFSGVNCYFPLGYDGYSNYSFYDMNISIPIYVPKGTVDSYRNAIGWSQFTNYQEQFLFTSDENDLWSDDWNWYTGELPDENDVVCINSNCHLDMDSRVRYLYVYYNNDVFTVNSGKTLTTTYGVGTQSPSQLVITDGSQLIANNPVQGVVQKHIDAFTSADDGWNFIASPVTTPLTTANVSGLIPSGATVYDLYYLDEENTKWFNYKALDGNADPGFDIVHKRGYLYSNGAGTTINFSGTLQPYVESGVTINLAREGDGWNLVGNPFTFNAYVNKSYFVINGRNVEVYTGSAPIAPCTGIVVKATGDNETVTFTKDNPIANSNQGNLNIVVAEQLAARDVTSTASAIVDKAIVSFNEGCQLEKFVFNEGKAKLYIPQGQEEFAIATSEYCGEMPVNFRANENGQYTITVNPEDVEMGYLHLIDNMSGADIDLLDTPSYTFNAKTRDYASRFRLVFASVCKDVDGDNAAFAYYNGSEWVITNGEKATLMVFDAMGHIVISGDEINRVSTNGMAPGVYVLRLIQDNNVKTQKIVVR